MKRWVIFLLFLCGMQTLSRAGVVEVDSLPDNLKQLLSVSASPLFQDPNVPRFVMVDPSGKYLFGIGGYVSVNTFYDFNRLKSLGLKVNTIPLDETDVLRSQYLGMDLSRSRLSFRLLGDLSIGRINAYLETEFSGAEQSLALKHAYISIRSLTLGQTYSYFGDQIAPVTIDPEGPVASPIRFVPLLGYSHTFGSRFRFTASLEFTSSTMATLFHEAEGTPMVEPVSQRYPDFPLTLSYTDARWHLFLAWNSRLMTYPAWDQFKRKYTYAVQLNARYQWCTQRELQQRIYAQVVYTRGMGDCMTDLQGAGMNFWVDPSYENLYLIPAYGMMLSYELLYGRNTMSVIYSRTQVLGDYAFASELYRAGDYASVTYLCEVVDHGVVGVEGIWGHRTLVDGRRGNDVRVNLLLRYDF